MKAELDKFPSTEHNDVRYREWGRISDSYVKLVANSWEPHPLSLIELEYERAISKKQRGEMIAVEKNYLQNRTEGGGHLLFAHRVVYWTHYYRTFPLGDLPPEILTIIFRYVIWTAPNPYASIVWRNNVTHVCRRWRQLVISDSTIWNAIWFRDGPLFERSFAWLERAGKAPLDLRITDTLRHKYTVESISAVLNRILPKLSHLRMLMISLDDWDTTLIVLDRIRHASKQVSEIVIERFELHRTGSPYIQLGDGYEPKYLTHPVPLFDGRELPKLNYFSMSGVHIDWGHSSLRNLTTLDLRRLSLEKAPDAVTFRQLLASSPGLLKLCLDGAGPRWQFESKFTPVHIPTLKSLVLADFALPYACYVVSHFTAPNIGDLTIINFVGDDYSQIFMQLIGAFPEVMILTIYSLEVPTNNIRATIAVTRWLQSMKNLTYLKLANVQESFLKSLLFVHQINNPLGSLQLTKSPTRNDILICPELKFLDCTKVDPTVIINFAVLRRQFGRQINNVYFSREMANTMGAEQQLLVRNSTEKVGYLELGQRSPEEQGLINNLFTTG